MQNTKKETPEQRKERFDKVGLEITQDLINKDLLLD